MGEERRSAEVSAGGIKARGEHKKDDRKPNILHGGREKEEVLKGDWRFFIYFFPFLQGKLTYDGSRFSHTGWGALILDCAVSRPDTRQERARKSFFCLCVAKRPHKQHCAVFTGKVKKNHQGDFSSTAPGSYDLHASCPINPEARDTRKHYNLLTLCLLGNKICWPVLVQSTVLKMYFGLFVCFYMPNKQTET